MNLFRINSYEGSFGYVDPKVLFLISPKTTWLNLGALANTHELAPIDFFAIGVMFLKVCAVIRNGSLFICLWLENCFVW